MDSGYVSATNLADSRRRGIELIGPPRPNTSWQARTEGAFGADRFVVDWEARQTLGELDSYTGSVRPRLHRGAVQPRRLRVVSGKSALHQG